MRDVRDGAECVAIAALLGLADRRTLHAMDALWYRLNPRYRSTAHNERGLMAWERTAIQRYFPISGSILVVGAGGGRELLALARCGYDVIGYECNASLRAAARQLLGASELDAELHAIARDAAPEPDGRVCAAAIVGWSTYMLIPGADRRVAFLARLRRWLTAGSPVLLSFFTRSADDPRLARIASHGTALRRLFGREPVQLGDDLAPTYVHRFTAAELAAELDAAGYHMAHFEEQGSRPEDSGWAVAFAGGPAPPIAGSRQERSRATA